MEEQMVRTYRQLMMGGLEHLSRLDRDQEDWYLMPTYLTWQDGYEIHIYIRALGQGPADGFEFSDLGQTRQKLLAFYALGALPLQLLEAPHSVRYEDGALVARSNGHDLLHVYHRILFVIGLMLGAGYKAREMADRNHPPA